MPGTQIFGATAQKSAIYGEGYARHASLGAQKSAIPEKEIVIFALRKVLFPGKAWWELPGASYFTGRSSACTLATPTQAGWALVFWSRKRVEAGAN